MKHVLEIDGVQLSFKGRKILSAIYLQCETGKITGLLGRNGTGKSCLMQVIHGSLPAERSVRFDGVSVVEPFKRPELIRWLPQFHFIPKSLSLCRVFRDFELAYDQFQDRFPEFVGKERETVGSLSGGERRLVELYVILRSAAQFVLLDEPFTQLDPLQIDKVKELLVEEKASKGLLITDHMHRHIDDVCDDLYVLNNGRTYLSERLDKARS
jgi:ABC-type multidrug transport system ATPase subunit